jgi:hypothetical protein
VTIVAMFGGPSERNYRHAATVLSVPFGLLAHAIRTACDDGAATSSARSAEASIRGYL